MSVSASLLDNFVSALTHYIAVSGKTKKEIADSIGVPPTTFSSWCNGKHLPDMEKLLALSQQLNAPLEHFFNFSPDSIPDKELADLHTKVDTDEELVQFLKIFTQLSDEDKHLLTVLALKIRS